MSEKPEAKGRLSSLLHWYLNDPVSLAFSSAFTCGMVGLLFGIMVTSLFTQSLVVTSLVGAGVALLAGTAGAREQLKKTEPRTDGKRSSSDGFMRWFGLWYGASLMTVVALQVYGVGGNSVILAALINGSLIATMFACVLNRR